MKKVNLLQVLFAIVLLACQQEMPKDNYVTLSGKVENLNGGTIWMLNFDGHQRYINVKEDGTFFDTIRIEKPGAYLIDFEKKRSEIYVENNAKIEFNFDAKDYLNTLSFTGDYASLNNHLATKAKANEDFFSHMKEIYSLEAEACKQRLQEDYVVPFLSSLDGVTGISEELRELEKRNIQYAYLEKLGMFESYHPRYANKENYKAPEWLEKEVANFSKEDVQSLQYSTEYYIKLMYSFYSEASKLMEQDSTLSFSDAHLQAITSIENESVKNTMLFEKFSNSISRAKNKQETYDTFLANNTDESYGRRAAKLFADAIKLEPGSPSPKFEDYENHAGGTSSLDDFKGKYVYIDIWATWCGPCKRQIPFLEKIEEQYHGKNIEFVTISVDYKKDHDKWKSMVTEKGMKGIQLIAPDAFNSEFISAFNISGIPRFILVDPDGNLVTANAPVPEKKELIELFNKQGI